MKKYLINNFSNFTLKKNTFTKNTSSKNTVKCTIKSQWTVIL